MQLMRESLGKRRSVTESMISILGSLTTVSLRLNLQCVLLKYFFRQFSSQPRLLNVDIYRIIFAEPLHLVCILRSNFLNINLDADIGGRVCAIALAPPTELSKVDFQGSHCQNLNQIRLSAALRTSSRFHCRQFCWASFYVVSLV